MQDERARSLQAGCSLGDASASDSSADTTSSTGTILALTSAACNSSSAAVPPSLQHACEQMATLRGCSARVAAAAARSGSSSGNSTLSLSEGPGGSAAAAAAAATAGLLGGLLEVPPSRMELVAAVAAGSAVATGSSTSTSTSSSSSSGGGGVSGSGSRSAAPLRLRPGTPMRLAVRLMDGLGQPAKRGEGGRGQGARGDLWRRQWGSVAAAVVTVVWDGVGGEREIRREAERWLTAYNGGGMGWDCGIVLHGGVLQTLNLSFRCLSRPSLTPTRPPAAPRTRR